MLCSNPNNEVWLVSARSQEGLSKHQHIRQLNFATEHGSVLLPAGAKEPEFIAFPGIEKMRKDIKEIANQYPEARIKFFTTRNTVTFTHHRSSAAWQEMEMVNEKINSKLSEYPDFTLSYEEDKAYGEITHRDVDKGNFVAQLLRSGRFAGGIAIGDQHTDEGMFKAMNAMNQMNLNHQMAGMNPMQQIRDRPFFSLVVSQNPHQQTHAKYKSPTPTNVHDLLRGLQP